MFEGITTAQWLGFMGVGAFGAGLIALIVPRQKALAVFALWFAAPGLIGAVASSPSSPGSIVGLFLLFMLFAGIPWAVATMPAFVLVRLLRKWLRSGRAQPPQSAPLLKPDPFDRDLPVEEWREQLCHDLVRLLDEIETVQPLRVVALRIENVKMPEVNAKLDTPLSAEAMTLVQAACAANRQLNPTPCGVGCQEHWTSFGWPEHAEAAHC